MLPLPLNTYVEPTAGTIFESLFQRIEIEPFNLVATLIFFMAVIHTFFAAKIRAYAHQVQLSFEQKGGQGECFSAAILEFLGEVEVVFGVWVLPLLIFMCLLKGWDTVVDYMNNKVEYTEAVFVTIVMAIAASRPIVSFAESLLKRFAVMGGLKPSAWWLSILMIGPLLGSFITEPGAMTIAALLLAKQCYAYQPSLRLKYATLGLLFVNISIGGTLTHFAAPPIVMVVGPWHWDWATVFMNLGWRAVIAIIVSTSFYYLLFKKDLKKLDRVASGKTFSSSALELSIPSWVTTIHLFFLAWTVLNLHTPALCVGGFLFFLGFLKASARYQSHLSLSTPLLVGFFLAGLVTHGSLQGWWLEIVLSRLGEYSLFVGSVCLTAFNDNAAITFLASLVPSFVQDMQLQHAVVAGAVAGGGLTVIANAPNPAGQSILASFFDEGVIAPFYLLIGALVPTLIASLCFLLT